jgi:hypothetical protein
MEANTKNQYGCRCRHCSPRRQTICHGVQSRAIDEAMKRKRTYQDNMFKAYALLWERCAKAMLDKIASRSDCDSVVYNDPIALLRAIKEHSLNYIKTQDTRCQKYLMHSDCYSRRSKRTVKAYKITRDGSKRLRRFWNPIWEDY